MSNSSGKLLKGLKALEKHALICALDFILATLCKRDYVAKIEAER